MSTKPNLTTCSDCGREISRSATACPHCGRPVAGNRLAGDALKALGGLLMMVSVVVVFFPHLRWWGGAGFVVGTALFIAGRARV